MHDPRDCWKELKKLAEKGLGDPRKTAGTITAKYRARATDAEFRRLQRRVENTLHAYTAVPLSRPERQNRWLAVLEGARSIAGAKPPG